ncbi:hypothetical protein X975_22089, partial [Stegodyphus mimosarum]
MSSPVPEFREAHQYWQPLLNNDIIRPKPRRLGDMSKQDTSPTQAIQRTSSRERLFIGSPLRPYERDAGVGGSAPSLSKTTSRETLHPNSDGRTPSKEGVSTTSGSRETTPVTHSSSSTAFLKSASREKASAHG